MTSLQKPSRSNLFLPSVFPEYLLTKSRSITTYCNFSVDRHYVVGCILYTTVIFINVNTQKISGTWQVPNKQRLKLIISFKNGKVVNSKAS